MSFNKKPVRQAAVAASYDCEPSKLDAEDKILRQVESERNSGKKYVNHLLLRNCEEPDNLKFLIPVAGVPAVISPLAALQVAGQKGLKYAGLDRIVIVGNDLIGHLQDAFFCFIKNKTSLSPVKQVFVHEGTISELSRSNTARKILKGLNGTGNENILELPADSPLLKPRELLLDEDSLKYDLVLNINVREIAGNAFPRNYHWTFRQDNNGHNTGFKTLLNWLYVCAGVRYTAKEPNVWIWDLEKLNNSKNGLEVLDLFFSSRKSYLSRTSVKDSFSKLLLYEGEEFSSKRALDLALKMGPGVILELYKQRNRTRKGRPEVESDLFSVPSSLGSRISENIFGSGFKSKVKAFNQPGGLVDIDSLEDLVFVQSLAQLDTSLFPNYAMLQDFAKYTGNNWGNIYSDNWESIANAEFKRCNIPAQYCSGWLRQSLYPSNLFMQEAKILKNLK